MNPQTVSVIGYGRFGELLANILSSEFSVCVFDPKSGSAHVAPADSSKKLQASNIKFVSEDKALESDVLFYCVPISKFEQVLRHHIQILEEKAKTEGVSADASRKVFIDVLSVKTYSKGIFDRNLPKGTQALLTHPMFGPDSVAVKGLEGQRIVLDKFRLSDQNYEFWKSFFEKQKLQVIEMTADEHDHLAAQSQGLTHFVGRMLGECDFEKTPIDTLGATMLHQIHEQVCNDSWQLFEDLQKYNPYTVTMRVNLADGQMRVFNKLLPNRLDMEQLVVGIQGGKGSFNEQASRYYLSRTPELEFELHYLHTTENVLRALYEGRIDRGQFAIHNSVGGVVTESIQAMANYRFHIVEEYAIKISHALMIAPGADFNKVDTIMTHEQVLRQCKVNLAMKYSRLRQTSGEGDLVDHAKVAELLSLGELPDNFATMGSKAMADIYGLDIVEENLQDSSENFTSFLWVERPH